MRIVVAKNHSFDGVGFPNGGDVFVKKSVEDRNQANFVEVLCIVQK